MKQVTIQLSDESLRELYEINQKCKVDKEETFEEFKKKHDKPLKVWMG